MAGTGRRRGRAKCRQRKHVIMVKESSRKISNVAVWCGNGRCDDSQQLLPIASHPAFLIAKSSGLG
jgi:hypothetical protein